MANLFDKANRASGRYILIIFPLTLVVFCLSLIIWSEDTRTTVEGYLAIRSAKVGDPRLIAWSIALLLQTIPDVFGYWFLQDTNMKHLLAVSIFCAVTDVVFDMSFKVQGYGVTPSLLDWVKTGLESTVVFTGGSEISLTLSAGFLWQGLPEFSSQLRLFIPAVFALIAAILDGGLTGAGHVTNTLISHLPQRDEDDFEESATVTVNGKKQSFMQGARDR